MTKNNVVTTKGDKSDAEHLEELRDYLLHRSILSALYHRKRERFFALLDRIGKAFSLVAGSAAFSSFLPSPEAKAIAGFVVVMMSMLSLVMAWSDKARLHADLAQKFVLKEAELRGVGRHEFDESMYNIHFEKIVSIESSEPPILTTLLAVCANQIASMRYQPDIISPIPWWKQKLAHFIDFQPN